MTHRSLARIVFDKLACTGVDSRPDVRDRVLLRHLIVALQAVSLILTWKLWNVRESPPNLPALALPALDMSWALIVSLLIVPWRPTLGISLHTLLLVAAIAMDQMRIQPEFISLTIMMWATLPIAGTILLCRAHLFSLWLFAGLHKILSLDYFLTNIERLTSELSPLINGFAAFGIALVGPLCEITVALLLIPRRTRRGAARLALVLHAGILLYLIWTSFAVGQIWNVAVWPWNVALACIGLTLIAGWKESWFASIRETTRPFGVAAMLLVVMPIGYYYGVVDAYLAHCLYSENVLKAWYQTNDDGEPADIANRRALLRADQLTYAIMQQLNVPMPPAHRLYEDYFRRTAKRGDSLYIQDPRAWARCYGWHDRVLTLDGEYREGQKVGFWVHRYDNAVKMSEGEYVDGLEHGPWIHWFPDGSKEGAGMYDHGKMHGRWRFWYEDGRRKEAVYDQGQLVPQSEQ